MSPELKFQLASRWKNLLEDWILMCYSYVNNCQAAQTWVYAEMSNGGKPVSTASVGAGGASTQDVAGSSKPEYSDNFLLLSVQHFLLSNRSLLENGS